jgi:hypothetical protein
VLWGLDADLDRARLETVGWIPLDPAETSNVGYVGDFDGDGADDMAVGKTVLFRQPVND